MKKEIKIKIDNLPEIAKDIKYNVGDIKYKTPTTITYANRKFNININNYYEKIEDTCKCEFYRRLKNKPKNKTRFCDTTIKGL